MPHAPPPRRLPLLDALRGLCALVVLHHHAITLFPASFARLGEIAPLAAALAAFVSRRNTEAVLLFFVLSGFSIRLSAQARGLHDAASVVDYLRRRGRRIGAPYALALAVSGLVAHTVAPVPSEALSPVTLLGNLLFLQTAFGVPGQWFMPYAGNAPLWSLSFEVFFYLSYPLLLLGVAGPRRRLLCVAAVTIAGLAAGAVAPNPFAQFCAAALIWYFGVELADRHLHGRASLPLPWFAGLLVVLGCARLGPLGLELHGLWIGAAAFVAGSLLLRAGPYLADARGVDWLIGGLARVGVFSYPLYLLHVPILRACAAVLGDFPGALACGAAASLALAALCERLLGPAAASRRRESWLAAARAGRPA